MYNPRKRSEGFLKWWMFESWTNLDDQEFGKEGTKGM